MSGVCVRESERARDRERGRECVSKRAIESDGERKKGCLFVCVRDREGGGQGKGEI